MENKLVISVQNLSKSFGYLHILKDVSLTLEAANFYLLQGNNGQGKSTLLKVLATLYSPDSGKIQWCGKPVQDCLQNYRSQLFLLPHETGFYEEFSPLENLTFFTSLYTKKIAPKKIADKEKIRKILADLNLEVFLNIPIKNFSQGMKKRLHLCLMNLLEPKILLLDEPYAGLDNKGIDYLNNSLANYVKKDAIILLVSHQKESCGTFPNRFLKLHQKTIKDL